MTPTNFEIWLGCVIEFVPYDELMKLILAYDDTIDKPTVKNLYALIETYDMEFLRPLAELAAEYSQSEETMTKIRKAEKKLNKMANTETDTGATAKGWFDSVTGTFTNWLGKATEIISLTNGSSERDYDIKKRVLDAQLQNSKLTTWLIFLTIGAIIAVAAVYLLKKS